MRYLFPILVLMVSAAAQACPPGDINVTAEATGPIWLRESDSRWCQEWTFAADCDGTPFGTPRIASMRWQHVGDSTGCADTLAAKADRFRAAKELSMRITALDFDGRLSVATSTIVEDDIRPTVSGLVEWIQGQGDPTVGQMANTWRTIAGELSWVQTAEQADSLLYRIADSFEMTGVGLLNWIKANADWIE